MYSERRELRHRGDLCHLEPQIFDVLEFLIRNRDKVVSKDELIEGVWGGRIVCRFFKSNGRPSRYCHFRT
jgi:DNA-binding winged helix-turn-helix (wHTH) protein